MDEKLKTKAKSYALKNAVSHKGKANQGAVIAGLFNEGLEKSKVKDVAKDVLKVIKEVNSMSLEEQEKEFEKLKDEISERIVRDGLPELPNAKKGKVVMRTAPAASGVLHIGHALTYSTSFLYVKEYKGKLYNRIEDTNPEEVFEPAYKMIEEDLNWLFDGFENMETIIQSNRIELYYKYVEELLNKDAVYVCECSSEDFKKCVEAKKDCACRSKGIEENIRDWAKMLDKKGFAQGDAILRFKSDMKHKNPAMRDFPLARICEAEHPIQGKKYRVWPLMNLAVTVDDIELGVTHIIRGKDHRDNAQRQEMIYKSLCLEKKYPWVSFFGKYKFTDLELSKRKIRAKVEAGEYSGFDDTRLPTIVSIRKQGYKPQAFWKFAEKRGLSEADRVITKKEFFKTLDDFNKQ